MSEIKQNQQKVVLVPLKSAMVGFLLAFIGLGWFGIDRFYKGDIMLGLFKLFCPILALIAFAAGLSTAALVIIAIGCFFWFLDWILVPLGISRDNAKKLAQANGIALAPNNQASNSSTQLKVKNTNQKTKKMIFISLVVIVLAQIWISIWFLSANSISVSVPDDKILLAPIVFIVALIVGFALIYYFAWRYARQNKSVNNVAFIAFAIAFILIFIEFIAGRLGASVVLSCLFYISELCNCLSSFYFAYHDVYDFYNYSPHIGLLVNIPNIIFIIVMVIWFNKFDKSKKSSI